MLGLSRGSTLLAASPTRRRAASFPHSGERFGGRLRDGTCTGLLGRRAFSPMTRPLWASLPGRFPSMPVSDGSYYKTSGGNCQGGGLRISHLSRKKQADHSMARQRSTQSIDFFFTGTRFISNVYPQNPFQQTSPNLVSGYIF